MRFTLSYSGDLRANARRKHKHELRKEFHSQLKVLWQQEPLVEHTYWYDRSVESSKVDLNREVGPFRFVPLVNTVLHVVCELKVFMLRPESPGSLITQGGDIDNRIKTLFDALRVPKDSELPKGATPDSSENPFFCLLEDDNLITSVGVQTDRLLIPPSNSSEVKMYIQVETYPTKMVTRKKEGGYDISVGLVLS